MFYTFHQLDELHDQIYQLYMDNHLHILNFKDYSLKHAIQIMLYLFHFLSKVFLLFKFYFTLLLT